VTRTQSAEAEPEGLVGARRSGVHREKRYGDGARPSPAEKNDSVAGLMPRNCLGRSERMVVSRYNRPE